MYQFRATTSQQSAANNNSSVECEKAERKIVKCKWYKKAENLPSLTHETIKNQIGNCTICFRLPKPDCIQLPACLCIFCKDCFYQYLDCFASSKPVVKKAWISRDPSDYKRWNKEKFVGIFDSRLLCCEGTVVPTAVKIPKPNVIKSALDFDSRNHHRRTRKIPDDRNWYRIVKNECFDCPNCHEVYDMNRSELKRNRAVSDILQKLLENDKEENDNISPINQEGISC